MIAGYEILQRKAELFEDFKVIEQLRCGGVIEAVRMCRESYPSRFPHEEFITTFSSICPEVYVVQVDYNLIFRYLEK